MIITDKANYFFDDGQIVSFNGQNSEVKRSTSQRCAGEPTLAPPAMSDRHASAAEQRTFAARAPGGAKMSARGLPAVGPGAPA
jgi:hypothetical protein